MEEATSIIASRTVDPLPLSTAAALLAGSFADQVAAIWRGERRAEYLTAPDARRHVWHAWLSAHENAGGDTNEPTYERLTRVRGRVLMAEAYGDCPAGLLSALGRLGPQARRPGAYRALVAVLARGGEAAKYVHHGKDLSDGFLIGLAALPRDEAHHDDAILGFRRHGLSGQAMATLAWALPRMRAAYGQGPVDAILVAADPWDALWDTHAALGFPPPPWPATERLVPLESTARLRNGGERLKNCMGRPNYPRAVVRGVVDGLMYFYEWLGAEPAFLMFERVTGLGWYLASAGGVANAWLSAATRDKIVTELGGIPEICPVADLESIGFNLGSQHTFYAAID